MTAPAGPQMTPEQRERVRAAVMDNVAKHPRPRRHPHRRRNLIISVSVIGATLVSAAAWVILAPLSVRERQVWCYEEATQNSRHITVRLADQDPVNHPGAIAVGDCITAWSLGLFDHHTSPTTPAHANPVPPLAVCIRPDGILAVFPAGKPTDTPSNEPATNSAEICAQVDLEPFAPPTP